MDTQENCFGIFDTLNNYFEFLDTLIINLEFFGYPKKYFGIFGHSKQKTFWNSSRNKNKNDIKMILFFGRNKRGKVFFFFKVGQVVQEQSI